MLGAAAFQMLLRECVGKGEEGVECLGRAPTTGGDSSSSRTGNGLAFIVFVINTGLKCVLYYICNCI